jgi:plastocyanin
MLRSAKRPLDARSSRLPARPAAYDARMSGFLNHHAVPLAFALVGVLISAPAAQQSEPGGAVTGTARFEGTAPAPAQLKMAADPVCVREAKNTTSEAIIVGDGGVLQNVFVYVKDGLGARTYPPPATAVVLDQRGCRYTPHVFGVQVGQPVEIVNSDPTLHNVHAMPKANDEFNFGQPVQGMRMRRTFSKPEVMVPVRCDVHGWMNAYAGVVTHPFHAVTKADGTFTITGLPPGKYTLEAWHERLGTQTQAITIDGKKDATATFSFTPRS